MIDLQEYITNPIKRHIVGLLMKNKTLKYSDLMPQDVDNVLFNYHLQHLVKVGLIAKNDNYYSLSEEGLKSTTNITDTGLYFPKFSCKYKMYLIRDGKVLMQHIQRTRWHGDVVPLTSKVVMGTSIEERANFRMKEKTDLITNMKWIGTLRTLATNDKKDLFDDSIYFICYATSFIGNMREVDDNNEKLSWYTFSEAIRFEEENKGSGTMSVEILKRFQNNNFEPFAFEEIIEIKP